MKQNFGHSDSEGNAVWDDLGPRRTARQHRNGPVRISIPGQLDTYRTAYDQRIVSAVVEQGERRPRALTYEEQELAAKNKAIDNEDRRIFERWVRSEQQERSAGDHEDDRE